MRPAALMLAEAPPTPVRPPSRHAVLTRHFLRRFLENDLIAPDADRTQTLAVAGAALFSTSLFITVSMSLLKYVVNDFTPGEAAVEALDDRFLYISLSMVVVALAAVMQWDALAVDARDQAILGPLPVAPLAIHRAKLAAIALFGLAAAAIVNLMPAMVFPFMLLFKYHTATMLQALQLAMTHVAIVLAAAAFGYLSVIGVREGLAAVLGPQGFRRVSPWAQAALVIVLGSALLLLPARASSVERTRFTAAADFSPPMWFLGAYETAVGHIVLDQPRPWMRAGRQRIDRAATAAYRSHEPQLRSLASTAMSALAMVVLVTAAAYFVNARAVAAGAALANVAQPRRRRWLADRVRTLVAGRDHTMRAGFTFTMAAMWRSPAHRLTLTATAAFGIAISLVILSTVDLAAVARTLRGLDRMLVVQPLLVSALIVGFRHAVRIPAELRANWMFRLAWQDQQQRYLAGAKRAAFVGLVLPGVAVVFPLCAAIVGVRLALLHAVLGAAGGVVLIEALLLHYAKVPFACSYVPANNMKALGPAYVLLFFLGAVTFAGMEANALRDPARAVRLLAILAFVHVVLRVAAIHRARGAVDFDEAPEQMQGLGLHS